MVVLALNYKFLISYFQKHLSIYPFSSWDFYGISLRERYQWTRTSLVTLLMAPWTKKDKRILKLLSSWQNPNSMEHRKKKKTTYQWICSGTCAQFLYNYLFLWKTQQGKKTKMGHCPAPTSFSISHSFSFIALERKLVENKEVKETSRSPVYRLWVYITALVQNNKWKRMFTEFDLSLVSSNNTGSNTLEPDLDSIREQNWYNEYQYMLIYWI